MILFIFLCTLMVLLALWLVLPPLFRSAKDAKPENARTANLLVYQDQLRELQGDLESGLLTQAQYDQDKEEIERRLLEDVGDEKTRGATKAITTRKLAYVVAILIPVTALVLYVLVGSPKSLESQTAPPALQRP
ncbi:MAG TPA: c-type cytochrome biogenesis protein CcmI [Pyrinomonadaceae bacterium]|nr:c-type cytochrome biogenesis protein CcmI [Pyrinomonadaceae bacterium]